MNPPLKLSGIGYFEAPRYRTIKPAPIAEKAETVEIITGGKVIFEVNGEDKMFERGAIFWHIGGEETVFRYPPDDPYRCLVVRFEMAENCRTVPRISFWQSLETLDEFAGEMLRRFHDETIDQEILCEYVHRLLYWHAYLSTRRNRTNDYPEKLKLVLDIIRKPDHFRLTLPEIAGLSNLSEPYLYALFQRHLSCSPHKYMLNYRLRLARIRLASSGDEIKLIAEDCGFDNLESFYRAFHRTSGMSPGEYRRKQQFKN